MHESITVAEVARRTFAEVAKLKKEIDAGTKRWGRWRFDQEQPPALVHEAVDYEIVMTNIKNYAELGQWLVHLREKNWVGPEDLGHLVQATHALHWTGFFVFDRR